MRNTDRKMWFFLGSGDIILINFAFILAHYLRFDTISILGNQIFKNEIINFAPKECINLHTELLPKYRSLMPTFWVMKNDDSEM